jgi:hypothetical protein
MKYVQHPEYVQWCNEWTAIMLLDYALMVWVLVIIPILQR